MTGGGSIYTEDGTRVTHGFELHCDIDIGPNNLEVNFDRNRFHLEELTFVTCYDDPLLDPLPRPAPFDTLVGEGVGRFNGQSGYRVWFTFTDNGEPGTGDFARIEIRDPKGNLVLFVAGNLHNGNQQAHPENKTAMVLASAADATGSTPGDASWSEAATLAEPGQVGPAIKSADLGLTDAWFVVATNPMEDTGLPAAPAPSTQRVASPATVAIDWTLSAADAPVDEYLDADAGFDAGLVPWQQRFVNHLGASPDRLNPNAALQVHLPVAHQLSALS
jgi:hypothetical protein